MSFGASQSKGLFALAMVASMVVSFAGTAQADREWNGHERDAHEWHRHHIRHRHYVRAERYEKEDPYVVYAPPVVVEPPSGINIVIPLHIH